MPIHDLGYRAWQGATIPSWWRWWTITETGFRLAWRNRWLRRLMIVAWLPVLWVGVAFFLYENPSTRNAAMSFIGFFPQSQAILDANLAAGPEQARHTVWTYLMMFFFRYPQGVVMVLLVGMVAPPLIAQDVRSRAFLLYFSRPLTRLEYIFGKLSVVSVFLLLITTVPALVLYILAVLLSPELSVVSYTWDLPLRIVAASAVLIVPTASLALALSSLTKETRYASFAWFAVWIFGMVAFGIVSGVRSTGAPPPGQRAGNRHAMQAPPEGRPTRDARASQQPFDPDGPGDLVPDAEPRVDPANANRFNGRGQWTPLSLYSALGEVQSWVFGRPPAVGREASLKSVLPSAIVLIVITLLSWIVLYRRVSSPMRV